MRNGAMGVIEEGLLKGRKFLIPTEVYVEKGQMDSKTEFSLACFIHEKFIPSSGCSECRKESEEKQEHNRKIGL